MDSSIPVVDLVDFKDASRRWAFVEAVGSALQEYGFVAVEGHGIEEALLEQTYAAASAVFALDEETKRRCERPQEGRQRGYTPFGVEHAKTTKVADLKEFWHVGVELPTSHPLFVRGVMPHNVFPPEVPEFKDLALRLFGQMEGLALELLTAIGLYLDQPEGRFRDLALEGNSVLRIINYPDVGMVPAGAVRAAAHEDINLLTVLPASTKPGLELQRRDGQWMSVDVPAGSMICDTGDMMQLLTAGRLPATTHRVVNPEASDGGRMSMPFFLHPHPYAVLAPIDPSYGPSIPAMEFFTRRLKETGVK